MAKDITLGISADTREFVSGVDKGVIKPLDGIDKALDDVAKGGDEAGRKLEHSLDGARRETSQFKRDQTELGRATAAGQKVGTDSIELNAGQRTKILRTSIRQAGANAKTALAGDLSSMSTSAEGAVSSVGNTVGGILASFGPIGIGIGAAVGVATGIIGGMLQKSTERTKKFREEVKTLANDFIETAGVGEASIGLISAALKEAATTTDKEAVSLAKLHDVADRAGSSYEDLALAYAGNQKVLKELKKTSDDYLDSLYEQLNQEMVNNGNDADRVQAIDKKIRAQEEYNGYLNDASAKAKDAAKQEKLFLAAGGPEMVAKTELLKTIDSAYDETAAGVKDFIDKESGLFNVAKYIEAMGKREKALEDYQTTLATVQLSPAARSFIEKQGVESAASFLAGYKSATPAQQKELDRLWSEAGKNNSGDYLDAVQAGLKGKTITPPAIAKPDISKFDADLKRYFSTNHVVKVTLEGRLRSGKRIV